MLPDDLKRLEQLLRGRHPLITVETLEERLFLEGLTAAMAKLGLKGWTWSASRGLRNGVPGLASLHDETEHPAGALAYMLDQSSLTGRADVILLLDVAEHLPEPMVARMLKELVEDLADDGATLVVTGRADKLPEAMRAVAVPFELSLPDDERLGALVRDVAKRANQERQVPLKVTRKALSAMVRNLRGLTVSQATRVIEEAIAADMAFTDADVNHMLAAKRRLLHEDGLLEYVETPLTLKEIAGIKRLKRWLTDRAEGFSDEAEAFGLRPPRGVLMLGVPGAGKSLCAKAIASSWNRPLLRLDPSALYDRYIGESERRLRGALEQAEAMSPLVLWIDEIEKGFASAAAQSNDGGLSQRMFGTLLSWMQEHTAPVFIVATANNIDALPPELLRKGRFDEIFFVDLPSREVRKAIFRIHLKRRQLDPAGYDLAALAGGSDGYTGAEIESAIEAALFAGFPDRKKPDTEALLGVLRSSPSLSVTMGEKLDRLRAWAAERTVPAD
ncbi:MAG: AAA family ATPase [Planctomycetota bacterium]